MTAQLEQAARQALEALESDWDGCVNSPKGEAVTALRSALEQQAAQEPVSTSQSTAADSYLSALLRYTAGFYASAIEHGMKRGATADAVAHVERAARGLHRLATHPASPHAAQESIKEHDQRDVRCECCLCGAAQVLPRF